MGKSKKPKNPKQKLFLYNSSEATHPNEMTTLFVKNYKRALQIFKNRGGNVQRSLTLLGETHTYMPYSKVIYYDGNGDKIQIYPE